MRKLSIRLLVALLGGALLTACGSGNKPSGTASSGASIGATQSAQRVEICKQSVQRLARLSASAKAKLEQSCRTAGASHKAYRKLVHEVCEALASSLPSGARRERALNVCRNAP
jgi:hypothetical protein